MQFYHAEAVERNALQAKHLRAFEYLDTTPTANEPYDDCGKSVYSSRTYAYASGLESTVVALSASSADTWQIMERGSERNIRAILGIGGTCSRASFSCTEL